MTNQLANILNECKFINSKVAHSIYKNTMQYEDQKRIVYDILGEIKKGQKIANVMSNIKEKRFGWDSTFFNPYHDKHLRFCERIETPPEIREGEIQCPKCKTKKTVLVEMQLRSADEGFTYEIHCFNPKCKYVKRTDNF